MKNKICIICVTLITIILIITKCFNTISIASLEETTKIEYTESIEEFENPDIGFYYSTTIKCVAEGEWKDTKIQSADGLVHLRIGLKSFSAKANGVKDYDITDEHIAKLNTYMEQIRQNGGTVIIRFSYDDFDGIADLEPDIEQVEKHIEQLQPFFEQNEDIITLVETGFLGPWGEQHTSTIVTEENIKRVIQKMLEVVPESRTINVRRPLYYSWYTGVDINEIDEDIAEEGTDAYRIGIFNDGYLGSSSDLGTFKNRKKEITWLSNQATHTIYGGEAVLVESITDVDVDENGYAYNSPEHIEEEMFETHTSYLNEQWNYNLIQSWKNTQYTGKNETYKNSTVYTYIKNHLGYRFVLTETELPTTIEQSSTGTLNIKLKNVGAGNVVNEKAAYIILKNDTSEYDILTSLDVTKWASEENQDINLTISIDENIDLGNYEVYLKIVDKQSEATTTQRTIRFANEDVWNSEIAANKIGNIEVIESSINIEDDNQGKQADNAEENKTNEEETDNVEGNKTNEEKIDNAEKNSTNTEEDTNTINKNNADIATTAFPYAGKQNFITYLIYLFIVIDIILLIKYTYHSLN